MDKKINIKERYINRENHKRIYLKTWYPENKDKPRGAILIIHGMGEHINRYNDVAQYFKSKDFVVYGSDLRGHGRTGLLNGKPGHIGKDGFRRIVKDQLFYVRLIKNEFPDIPVYLLGHSFGSLVTQKFIQRYSDEIDGAILSGTTMQTGIKITSGKIFSALVSEVMGDLYPGKLLNKITFADVNRKFKNAENKSWISEDPEVIQKFDKDPLSKFELTNGFYYEVLKAMESMYTKKALNSIRKDLPILFITGGADPLSDFGRQVAELFAIYKTLNMSNVDMRFYPGVRHEVLNSSMKEKVYKDVLNKIEEWEKNGKASKKTT